MACEGGGRSRTAPLGVGHIRSESDTGPGSGPQRRGSSGGGVGSEVKAPVWAPGYC